ncbi:hypothetical protein ACFOEY_19910 [Paracandidimonas soli]|uniref:hypothetical protein n=1 Tax=Paracandidimonas soli TaxID=1917182 RepID=UPI003614D089
MERIYGQVGGVLRSNAATSTNGVFSPHSTSNYPLQSGASAFVAIGFTMDTGTVARTSAETRGANAALHPRLYV